MYQRSMNDGPGGAEDEQDAGAGHRGARPLALLAAGLVACSASSSRKDATCAPSVTPRSATVHYGRASIGDVRVYYREAGSPAAPAIVLLHGFPSSSHQFRALIPRLATRFHVIAPDYPGFGNSDRPAPSAFAYTFDHLAETIERFLADRGLQSFVLFLHDYGGPIGFRIASRHPERIRALVIQNANAYAEGLAPSFLERHRALWSNRTPESEAPVAKYLAEGGWRAQYTRGARDESSVSADDVNLDAWGLAQPDSLAIQMDLQFDYRTNLERYDEWHRYLREHRPPTLVVWGKNDAVFTPAGAWAFRKDVPDCEVHLLDEGHFPLEEDPDTTADLVLDFLARRMLGDR